MLNVSRASSQMRLEKHNAVHAVLAQRRLSPEHQRVRIALQARDARDNTVPVDHEVCKQAEHAET